DVQRIPPIILKAGLFQANSRTAYSDVRERRKNTFPETEKAFLSSPQRLSKSPNRQRGKGESLGKPTLSTGCYACPMFGHTLDGGWLLYNNAAQRKLGSTLVLVFSILSMNFIGLILGLIGGFLGYTYKTGATTTNSSSSSRGYTPP